MQSEMNTRAEIIALLKARPQVSLKKIHQFILDLDELDYIEFLYPSDPNFSEELGERAVEVGAMIENLRDMETTVRDLDQGKIRIQ